MNELQWTNETHFLIKTSLSHFILERGTQFVVSYKEGTSSWPISSSLYTLATRIVRDDTNASDRLRIPWLDSLFWLDWLSKADRVISFR